jgi:type I restriction enzyme S subunit
VPEEVDRVWGEGIAEEIRKATCKKVEADVTRGWTDTKLSTVLELAYGKSLPKRSRKAGPYPVYGSNGVVGYHSEAAVQGPGIIVGRKGSCGEVHYCGSDFWPIDTTYYVTLKENANLRFVAYLLSSMGLSEMNSHSTIPGLNRERVYQIPVSLPPLPEQEKIAAVLLKIQRAIQTQENIMRSLRDLKKSAMQHVFTHGLRGEKAKVTEIGEIPESWEVVPLGQIASIERGKFTHRPRNDPDYYGGDIPFIQTGDVAQSNGRIRTYSQTLNKRGLSVSKIFPSGTILITIAANIGDTSILDFDSAFPDSIIGITPGNEVNSQYLEFYLRTQKRRMHQLAPKGTQMNINIQFLKPWPVKLPPTKEQLKIAQVLSCLVQKEEMHESQKSALQDLFKTTLNKLMTGEIRVGDLDIDVSEVEI